MYIFTSSVDFKCKSALSLLSLAGILFTVNSLFVHIALADQVTGAPIYIDFEDEPAPTVTCGSYGCTWHICQMADPLADSFGISFSASGGGICDPGFTYNGQTVIDPNVAIGIDGNYGLMGISQAAFFFGSSPKLDHVTKITFSVTAWYRNFSIDLGNGEPGWDYGNVQIAAYGGGTANVTSANRSIVTINANSGSFLTGLILNSTPANSQDVQLGELMVDDITFYNGQGLDLSVGSPQVSQPGAILGSDGLLHVSPNVPMAITVPVSGSGFQAPENRITTVTLQAGTQTLSKSVNLADIQSGKVTSVTFDVTLGVNDLGPQSIAATIDPENELNEANFNDNTAGVQVDVINILTINTILAQGLSIGTDGTITGTLGIDYTFDGYPVNTSIPFCVSCGQPVNLANGAMWHQMTDFTVSGRTTTTSLNLTRTYLAQPIVKDGDFGPHWFDNWETRILPTSSGSNPNLLWLDETGGAWIFSRNSDGTLASPSGFFGTLTEYTDHYELRKPHGTILRFVKVPSNSAMDGKLVSIMDPHGESVQLSYDNNGYLTTVSTGLAGSISFNRDSSGHVVSVTRDRDSLTYTYNYDQNGRLSNSSDFDGNTTSYGYQSTPGNTVTDGLLNLIQDPLGRRITFSYQNDGKASSQTEPGQGVRSFRYGTDEGNAATWVTGIDGNVTEYEFDSGFRLIKTIHPDGATELTRWNDQNQISQTTDALGYVTKYGYHSQGNVTSIQKPNDQAPTTIAYDQAFNKPTLITPLSGAPTQFQIDPNTGDVLSETRSDGTQSLALKMGYDSFGNVLSVDNGRINYSDQTDSNGLKTFVFDSNNPETRTYDDRGRVTTRTFKSGRVLNYSYDNHDRITKIEDSNGPTLSFTYDVMGRVLSRTLSDGSTDQVTQYQWDSRDRLLSETDPLGNKKTYEYDIHHSDGSVQVLSKPIAIVDELGHRTTFSYDSRDRLIQKMDANGGITKFGYNARGDLIALIDPMGEKTTFDYDGNDRLVLRSRPSLLTQKGGKTFSAQENTQYLYDPAGRLVQEQRLSPTGDGVTGITEYKYDSFDRVIEKTEELLDSKGNATIQDDSHYTYEPQLDTTRLTSANNAVEKLSFNYEAAPPFKNVGYSVQASDSRNALGLIQGQYQVTQDVTDEIASIQDQTGHTLIHETYDPAGRLLSIESGDLFSSHEKRRTLLDMILHRSGGSSLTASIIYDSFGRKAKVSDSTGLIGTYHYDEMNRPTQIQWNLGGALPWDHSETIAQESPEYDAVGNIIGDHRPIGDISYGYDALNQLTDVSIHPESRHFPGIHFERNFSRSFAYDQNGNRIQDTLLGDAQFLNNQIISNSGSSFQSDLEGFGNLTAEISHHSVFEKKYSYRVDEKLIHFERALGSGHDRDWDHDGGDRAIASVDYYYDALGRRVAKAIRLGHGRSPFGRNNYTLTYAYLSDQDKILLGKAGNGELNLYLDGQGLDEHLGQVSRDHVLAYATDHLGSVLNSPVAGLLHSYGPFGETLPGWQPLLSRDSDPVNYGYTGRQFDAESGDYYYRARMYNPMLGRFITKDPLGFGGGSTNLYSYTLNDPVNWTDPSGTRQAASPGGGIDPIYYDPPISPNDAAVFKFPTGPAGIAVLIVAGRIPGGTTAILLTEAILGPDIETYPHLIYELALKNGQIVFPNDPTFRSKSPSSCESPTSN